MATITQPKAASASQIKQISRFAGDAVDKVLADLGLDNPSVQRVIEHGDEFVAAIREAALTSLKDLSVSDKFKDEEVGSSYGYLSGYTPKDIREQVQVLEQLFPGVGKANEALAGGTLPPQAEGWFAIPRWSKIAPTYHEALQKVLGLIKQNRGGKFHNYREGQLGQERLRRVSRTEAGFKKSKVDQADYDILVVPAQFGIRHRGRSVRHAREIFLTNEFGLGAYEIGIMLLTHPERLQHYDDLWIDCAGDEYDDPDAGDRFGRAPFFSFYGGQVGFDSRWFYGACERYGSASVFLPR